MNLIKKPCCYLSKKSKTPHAYYEEHYGAPGAGNYLLGVSLARLLTLSMPFANISSRALGSFFHHFSIKMKEYLNKTIPDLANLLFEKRTALRNFRFGSTGGKQKNVKEGRSHRTEIARIMTTLSAKSNEAAKAAGNRRMK